MYFYLSKRHIKYDFNALYWITQNINLICKIGNMEKSHIIIMFNDIKLLRN